MEIKLKLKPFSVPNFVVIGSKPGSREDGFSGLTSFSIKDVDAETLSELCDKFREDIFIKAGKEDPKC